MRPEIRTKLQLCPQLPTLSGVALRLVETAREPTADLASVTTLIARDPALAARILRVANSPLYPQFRQVNNLAQAVQVLGFNAVITLSLGFSLATTLRTFQSTGIDLELFWRRALISALAARLLGEQQQLHTLDELFLAGLLQDIGRLALDVALPDRVPAPDPHDHDTLLAHERNQLGTDHVEAGAWLLQSWGLPDFFKLAIWSSHDRSARHGLGDLTPFVGCVAVSGLIADIYITPDATHATHDVHHAATACLGLTSDELSGVLDRLVALLPEIQQLFDTSILSVTEAAGLTAQAQELILCRNLKLIETIADESSPGDDLKQIADQLYEAAYRDALTGVYNRRHFDDALETAFGEAGGQRQPLSMAYLDLDNFKAVNDQYGHMAGDAVLIEVARTIQSFLRPTDHLARYGGEEFVVLLPGLDQTAALTIIERIRAGVEALQTPIDDAQCVQVTLSAGLATYRGDVGLTTADLVKAADEALYQAKRAGRNCVVTT